MIPSRTARSSKKGDNAAAGQTRTEHGSGLGRTRWVVERSLAWLHQFRKLKIREEKYPSTHEALMLIACSLICNRFLDR
jgi:transposase